MADWRVFTEAEHQTWRALYQNLEDCRQRMAHPLFAQGLAVLGIDGSGVPDLERVNARLSGRTGWRGVPTAGFIAPRDFFQGLKRREFPIGNFIRDGNDLSYTPEPDVFHDLYGHLPFLADADYADFCQGFGEIASRSGLSDEQIIEYDRLFWFGVEFPLVKTPAGMRIFGGGILSSYKESHYALSLQPKVLPFTVATVKKQDFRIDIVQETLFTLESPQDLYQSLGMM